MSDPELQAVESALNTLALADSEAALQKVVNRLLPALLSALSTDSSAARAKCIETLKHINVRVRALPSLKLPFSQVLDVAVNPSSAVITTNVAIQGGYLTRCFDRLSQREKTDALPSLLQGATSVSSQLNKDSMHYLALRALAAAAVEKPRSGDDSLWQLVAHCPEPAVFDFFDYALLALRQKVKAKVSELSLLASVRLASEYASVKKPERAAKVFPHFLVAAGTSTRTALVSAGEDALKRVDTCDVLAAVDPTIADILFELFNDTLAEIPLRIVILSKGLLRVTLCASCFPEVLDVIKHSLFTPGIPARFQALGMAFVSFVIRHSEDGALEANASQLVELMMKLVQNETEGSPPFPSKVHGFGYTALAEIVIRVPSLMGQMNMTTQLFFTAAKSAQLPAEVRTCASQGLVSLTRVIDLTTPESSDMRKQVLPVLLETVENEDDVTTSARSAAVQWANECFRFGDCEAQLINIVAASDVRPEIRQMANAGLSSKRWLRKDGANGKQSISSITYPQFEDIVHVYSTYGRSSIRPKSVAAYLQFALTILRYALVPGGRLELLRTDSVEKFFDERPPARHALKNLCKSADSVLLNQNLRFNGTLQRSALSVLVFTSKIESMKQEIAKTYSDRIQDLVGVVSHASAVGDFVFARAVAEIVGVASETLDDSQLQNLVGKLATGLEPNSSGVADGRHGEDDRAAKILCIGRIATHIRRKQELPSDESQKSAMSEACLHITRRITLAVDSSDVVRVAACSALAEMGASGLLPVANSSRENVISNLAGILKLHGSSSKLVQAGCEAMGRICVGEPRQSFKKLGVESLLCVCKERKEEDIRFVASENLVRCASGFDAPPPSFLEEDQSSQSIGKAAEAEELQNILQWKADPYVVTDSCREQHIPGNDDDLGLAGVIRATIHLTFDERPNARAGGCVALFTFLRLLGTKLDQSAETETRLTFRSNEDLQRFKERQAILSNLLPEVQQAFTVLLGDRSDFVQQLSSCGVALVYEMCPPDGQRELVTTLVRSLTAGKARAASVVPGDQGILLELGGGIDVKEGSAGQRSGTYKELCSLAQDMGQPELVYKFMDLAGHTALWNNRKGAALAGSTLLQTEIAAQQLGPHVDTLLPRLYVYCYDPTESVRIAMSSVIAAVVKAAGYGSVAEAITQNFSSVTQYCLQSISARQWRVREAACGSLRDVLVSRTWNQVGDGLTDFWYYTLRALDDIKESVRKAAEGTGRAISELSIHLCDPGQVGVDVATKAIAVVIPVVLPGFTHSVWEVRMLATTTLTKIIRRGGDALRASVPELVSCLLEAATELEPQELNYAQFHVDEPDELQSARVNNAATSMSPLNDSLDKLAGLVDESVVQNLIPRLTRLARIGVGIPTRSATARFYATVLQFRAVVMEPFASKLMMSATGAAGMERNATLRAAWCDAAGVASKLSSTEDVGKYIQHIADLSGSEDAQERALASALAFAFWKKAPDTARLHASTLLPVAYMGQYETDEGAKGAGSNWKEVWGEGAPSPQAGLRLYAEEITQICEERLSKSTQYRVKRSAAAALGALFDASNETIDLRYLRQAAKALVTALPGHIWDGKLVAVDALGTLAASHSDLSIWHDVGGAEVVVRCLLREVGRGKKEYRMAALESTTKLLNKCHDCLDMYAEVTSALTGMPSSSIEQGEQGASTISRVVWETGSDADAVDARNKARKAQKLLSIASISCAVSTYPSQSEKNRQLRYISELIDVIESATQGDWDVRLGVLQSLRQICLRSHEDVILSNSESQGRLILTRIVNLAALGIRDSNYAVLRRCGLSILLAVSEQVGDKKAVSSSFDAELLKAIRSMGTADRDPGVQSDAKKVSRVFQITASTE